MALPEPAIVMLKPVLTKAKSVFCLGYPDIVMEIGRLEALFDISLHKVNPENEFSKHLHGVSYDIPDTEEFFEALGVEEFKCCDLKSLRGCEIVADLNYPQDFGQYDLVIDPGTIEHCFNIWMAALTASNTVKPGGAIFHDNPLSMVNHGFYMLSPTWYVDWYQDNGWEIIIQAITDHREVFTNFNPIARVKVASELSNMVLARKPIEAKPMAFPTQSKYKVMLN